MPLPRLIVTGASGFIGRRVVDALKDDYQIIGIARRSQARSGAAIHPNVTWFQVDIGDRTSLGRAFSVIREAGGAEAVIHLAAHYDFTGDKDPEYWRTNVQGLRNVLDECVGMDLRGFVFASSVAACAFPAPGKVLTEESPPDGDHVYAVTKRMGEEMLAEYDGRIKSCIVRFAAMFSDWCEYAPLYFFLDTWLSSAWNSRILGGRGLSAIPYLHLREIPGFFRRVMERLDEVDQREVLIASPSGTNTHRELFDLANVNFRGRRRKPLFVPKLLAALGVYGRDLMGRALGNRPFERPWMMKYVDLDLAVDATRTYRRLDWRPRERLLLPRRMPFMVEHLKRDPVEWHRRNREAMKKVHLRSNLRIHGLLEKHHDLIRETFIRALLDPEEIDRFPRYHLVRREILEWRYVVLLRHLMNSIRSGDKGLFTAFCRDVAERRQGEGFSAGEVCGAFQLLSRVCRQVLAEDPDAGELTEDVHDHITMTFQFGCDQVMETYEELGADIADHEEYASTEGPSASAPPDGPGAPPAP